MKWTTTGTTPYQYGLLSSRYVCLGWGLYWFYTQFDGVSHTMNKDNQGRWNVALMAEIACETLF